MESVEEEKGGEDRFRERYGVLKGLYEERLKRLTACVRQMQGAMDSDPVLREMRADETTARFAPQRELEMATEALAQEREEQIVTLSEELSDTASRLGEALQRASHSKARSRQLEAKLQEVARAREMDASRLEEAQERVARLEEDRARERKVFFGVVRRLGRLAGKRRRGSGDPAEHSGDDDDDDDDDDDSELEDALGLGGRSGGRALDAEAAAIVARAGKVEARFRRARQQLDKERTHEVERLRNKLAEKTRAVQSIERKAAEFHKACESLRSEVSRTQDALAKSEAERLELREQYMAIGAKLERIASSNEDNQRRGADSLRSRLDDTEARNKHLSALNDRLEKDLNASELKLERREAKAQDLEERLRQAQREHSEQMAAQANAHKQQLDTAELRHKHVCERLEECKREFAVKLQRATEQAAEAVNSSQSERQRWEAEKDRQLKEFQAKLENQFQRLLDAKQKELDAALRGREAELERKQDEAERVERAVAARMQALLQDHIPLAQHKEILEQQVGAAQDQGTRTAEEAQRQGREEIRRAVDAAEAKLKSTFDTQLLSATLENKRVKKQAEQALKEQQTLERSLEEDRRRIVQIQHRLEVSQQAEKLLKRHLEKAVGNLDHLKKLLRTEQRRRMDAESKTKGQLAEEAQVLRTTVAQLQAELDGERARATKLEEDKAAAEKQHEERTRKLTEELSTARSRTASEIEAMRAGHERAQEQQLLQRESEVKSLEARLRHETELLQVKARSAEQEGERQAKALRAELAELRARGDEQREREAQATTELEVLKEKARAREEELTQMRGERASLQAALERATKRGSALHERSLRGAAVQRDLLRRIEALRQAHSALTADVRSQLDHFAREALTANGRVREAVRVREQQRAHAITLERSQAESARKAAEDALQAQVAHLTSKVVELSDHSRDLRSHKESVEQATRAQVEDAADRTRKLEGAVEAMRLQASNLQEQLQRAERQLAEARELAAARADELAAANDRAAELERQMDLRQNNFLALLGAVRGKLALPQPLLDLMVDAQRFAAEGAHEVHAALEQALVERDERVVGRAVEPLQAKNRQLRNVRKELAAAMEGLQSCERDNTTLREQVERLEASLAHGRQRVEAEVARAAELKAEVSRLQERLRESSERHRDEVAKLEEKHAKSSEELKVAHGASLEALQREKQRTEQLARQKVDREKQRNRQLRDEILSQAEQLSLAGSPLSPRPPPVSIETASWRGGPGANDVPAQTVASQGPLSASAFAASGASAFARSPAGPKAASAVPADVQRLLQRSAALDSAAQDLVRSSVTPRRAPRARTAASAPRPGTAGSNGSSRVSLTIGRRGW